MKNLLLVITLILITAISCKKEEDTITPVLTFAPEALAFVKLPLNRQFVYKDSATGNIDSVVVTTSDLSTILIPARTSTSLFTPSEPAYYSQKFSLVLTLFNGSQTSWYNASDNAKSILYNVTPIDAHPLKLGGYDNFLASNIYISGIGFSYDPQKPDALQSLVVEGTTYNNVLKYITTTGSDADSAQSWYYKSIYYWAKGIGIIKRTGKTSKGTVTANLIRYKG